MDGAARTEAKNLIPGVLNVNRMKMLTRKQECYTYVCVVCIGTWCESLIRFEKRLGKSTNIYQHARARSLSLAHTRSYITK